MIGGSHDFLLWQKRHAGKLSAARRNKQTRSSLLRRPRCDNVRCFMKSPINSSNRGGPSLLYRRILLIIWFDTNMCNRSKLRFVGTSSLANLRGFPIVAQIRPWRGPFTVKVHGLIPKTVKGWSLDARRGGLSLRRVW